MNSETLHILIVDDDPVYATQLQRSLQRRGHSSCIAHDALSVADARVPDAALVDLKLADESGLRLIEPLRALSEEMVIVLLTGYASVATAVEAIKRGADDYLPKPGNPRELLARLRAVLRRRAATTAAAPRPEVGVQQFGRCTLDHARRILVRDGVEQRLTSGEFALLSVLLRHAGQPLSRDRLMSLAHGRDHEPFERSIDVTVSRLRRMIEDDPKHPRHLQTVWGQGYVFVAD